MKTKQLFISLILGLGLTLALLWVLGGVTLPAAYAAGSPCPGQRPMLQAGGVITVCLSGGCDYASIQAAVDAAVPGDEILVATGTYTDVHVRPRNDFITIGVVTQVVYISKTVTVRGGYTTTNWTTPYPITQPTTLDAQRRGRVLYITGDPSASSGQVISPTIEGLRITGGNATRLGGALGYDAGGGVYVISTTAVISNNQVFSNTAEYGGGLFLGYGDATLSGNTVFSNTAALYGGGLCLGYSDATLSGNTVFSNIAGSGGGLGLGYSDATLSGNTVFSNTAALHGGGLFLGDSPSTLSGNTISDNTADTGGGLFLTGSDTTLTNDVVADNQANSVGSGLYIWQSSPQLLHTTIARNGSTGLTAGSGDGSGVHVTSGSTVALTNTILVSHSVGITVTSGNTATLEATLWGTGTWANGTDWGGAGTIITGTRNYWGAPAFVDPDAGDYHISLASEAIDRGVDAGMTTDIDGDARPDGCFFDIGADELITGVECKRIYLPVVLRQYP